MIGFDDLPWELLGVLIILGIGFCAFMVILVRIQTWLERKFGIQLNNHDDEGLGP